MDIKREDFNNKQELERVREEFDDKKVPEDILAKKAQANAEGKSLDDVSTGGSGIVDNGILGYGGYLINALNGKHIDVDALSAYIEDKYGYDVNNIALGLTVANEGSPMIDIFAGSQGTDDSISIFGVEVENVVESSGAVYFLETNKEAIEAYTVQTSGTNYSGIYVSVIYSSGGSASDSGFVDTVPVNDIMGFFVGGAPTPELPDEEPIILPDKPVVGD